MKNFDNIGTGIDPIINLSDVPTSDALDSSALCESVRVKITNITPSRGAVTLPVRYTDRPVSIPIDFLEDVVSCRIATKNEFRLLKRLCLLLG